MGEMRKMESYHDKAERAARMVTGKRGSGLSRRRVLQAAGCAIGVAALRPWVAMATEAVSPVMARLSTYMSEARDRPLPSEVLEKVKQHVLDTIAAMVSGAELPPGIAALKFARSYGGEKVATVVCSTNLCGPIEAALVNGMLAHSDETDDSHAPSLSHPGCAVVPAALAAGEQFGVSGMQFLRAVALGYDVGPRVTMTLGGPDFQMKQHRSTHSVSGEFGATAAAGCIAGLNAQQMRWLLDYAAQQAGAGIGAWRRDTDHIEKAFVFGGMGARNGVNAALVVHSGWTGVNDILSGPNNFVESYNPKADPAGLIEKLGQVYGVMQTTLKKW